MQVLDLKNKSDTGRGVVSTVYSVQCHAFTSIHNAHTPDNIDNKLKLTRREKVTRSYACAGQLFCGKAGTRLPCASATYQFGLSHRSDDDIRPRAKVGVLPALESACRRMRACDNATSSLGQIHSNPFKFHSTNQQLPLTIKHDV